MTVTWIIGQRGLLGSSVASAVKERECWSPTVAIQWTDRSSYEMTVGIAVREFAQNVRSRCQPWTVYWCAGIAVLSAEVNDAGGEFEQIDYLVRELEQQLGNLVADGTFFYSSSVGGVYGGSVQKLITEESEVAANSSYGKMKLSVERLLEEWSRYSGCRIAIGRITNLYGPGQDLKKRQGLISTICRALVLRQTIDIFVPLDTTRNYLFVGDAGRIVANFTRAISNSPQSTNEFKVICSPFNLSIAAVLYEIRRVFGHNLPLNYCYRTTSDLYVRRLVVASGRFRETEPSHFVLPAIGIAHVRRELLRDFMNGTLTDMGPE